MWKNRRTAIAMITIRNAVGETWGLHADSEIQKLSP
jgi:hypothetical protein